MATSSQVKTQLDAVAKDIADARNQIEQCKGAAGIVSQNLSALPNTYEDLVTTINAYGTTDAFEANAKATLAKLVTEYTALVADADVIANINLDN